MHFIDTHCHVDLYSDYLDVIDETEKAQIYTIAVTNTPSVFNYCLALTKQKRYIRTALGLHPQLVSQRHQELGLLIELLKETKYIGEIGLDFTNKDKNEHLLQQKVFQKILENCSTFGDKILTIHSRRAAPEVVSLIGDSYPGHIILHWFSGTNKILEKAISYGYYFSINSAMLLNEKSRHLIRSIPHNKLLTESDGPFVKINGDPSKPKDIKQTVHELANLLGIETVQMSQLLYANFRNLITNTR